MTSTESRFLYNVIWSWLGVVVNVVLGLILSAILLRRLGVRGTGSGCSSSRRYYLRLLDFG